MPFLETCRMEQRIRMLCDYDTGAFDVTQLCARYEVSRETFYVWLRRRSSGETGWFVDRSHAPLRVVSRTPDEVVARALEIRRRFPHFGPKKVRAWLMGHDPALACPSASTIGDILKRAGLVAARPQRRRPLEQGVSYSSATQPNEEWCVDFKGWFRTGDGARCDPLTLSDTASRYLIETQVTPVSIEGVMPLFVRAFREHGLPQAIRSDNGTPFGSSGAGGLTRLSAWWLRLGVEPHFIEPASPQQNGRHERMHRTLKAQTANPPADDLVQQQQRFDDFRHHYNHERPHEALGQTPPAHHWQPSGRPMPKRLEDPHYSAEHIVRRIRTNGEIKWKGHYLFISDALAGQLIGLADFDDGLTAIRFCNRDIGVINQRKRRFLRFAPLRQRLRKAQEAQPDLSGIIPV